MTWREHIKDWLGKLQLPTGAAVVDWGCGTKPALRYTPDCQPRVYTKIDKLDHVGADIVTDIMVPQLLGDLYDVAFCIEVLEHVEYPDDVVRNIAQNLVAGGQLYLTVPFLFPIHSERDFWRFTDQGIRELLERHGFVIDQIIAVPSQEGWMVAAHT